MREKHAGDSSMMRDVTIAAEVEAPFPVMPRFILCDTVTAHAPTGWPRHVHEHYEIIIVELGIYECSVDDVHLQMQPGDVLVIKPGDIHSDHLTPPVRYVAVQFALQTDVDTRSNDCFIADTTPARRCLRDVAERLLPITRQIAQQSLVNDGFATVMQHALIGAFVVELLRIIPPDLLRKDYRPIERLGEFRRRLTAMFSEHLSERLDVPTMANHLGVTPRSLTHLCRKELATSPARAFIDYKIERAVVLLRESHLTIGDISRQLGFDNQFHFSTVFKRLQGKPPKDTRRRVDAYISHAHADMAAQ
jgi:AraC family transcriptional regulator, transcriptional activator of pobA